MATMYHYKKARMALGPYRLERMRDLVKQAEIGRGHQVSNDGGATWQPAEDFSEIFEYEEPEQPPPPDNLELPIEPVTNDQDTSSSTVRREDLQHGAEKRNKRSPTRDRSSSTKSVASNTFVIAGFICSIVAAVLLAIPCLVWILITKSLFWIFNIVPPLGVLAVLGLTLSVLGLRKLKSGLATAGTVMGVIALVMTIMAVVAWSTIGIRISQGRRLQIDRWAADIELKRNDLEEALTAFRNLRPDADESDEQFQLREIYLLKVVAANLRDLAVNHEGHLTVTASTSEFRQAFEEGLPLLRKSVLEVQRAAEEKDLTLQEVLPSVNANSDQLKLLMDTLSLYEKGRLTLQQLEGKMTGK